MAENSTTTIVMVLILVVILCSSCSSGVAVAANEFPSFGGSFLDFLRGDWYNSLFGKKSTTVSSGSSGGDSENTVVVGDNEDDEEGDDKKDYRKDCTYLYKDKDGKKYVISKCTKDKKTYKGSKLDGVSSIRVGKDLTVYVYDKKDKEKKYKGKEDKVYNLSGNWNNDTRKIVLKHKNYKKDKDDKNEKDDKNDKDETNSTNENKNIKVMNHCVNFYKDDDGQVLLGGTCITGGNRFQAKSITAYNTPYFDEIKRFRMGRDIKEVNLYMKGGLEKTFEKDSKISDYHMDNLLAISISK